MRLPSLKRLAVIVLLALLLGWGANRLVRQQLFTPATPDEASRGATLEGLGAAMEVVATELEAPWELAFLPGGELLVTERAGRLVRLSPTGERLATIAVPGVRARGEGGLMGLALHPGFPDPPQVYLYLTGEGARGAENRIESWRLGPDALADRVVVLSGIPAAAFHDGGRVAFGPDGLLYATTGDAGESRLAQDRGSLAGKVLRMTPDGEPASGNPFGTVVFSYGHRNPQGLAWDGAGRLWSTEHGRSGLRSGMDEVNRIEAGENHGWPAIEGDLDADGMQPPEAHSGPDVTWAPASAAVLGESLFFGGLRGQALYEARLRDDTVTEVRVHLFGELGRIRLVAVGPDGRLYVGTSNRDGRGSPRPGDDRILRIDPGALR